MGCTRNWAAALLVVAATAGRAADGQRLEVWRDPWGVPHVFAGAAADGFFGWGYACAEDRRLQMELVRRKGAGRLAEVFGPEWVRSDREARLAGFAEYAPAAFARLPTEMQDWLRAYAAGVNAWTAAHPEAVARRFQPVGTAPEPWTPADCLLAARAALALGSPFSDQPAAAYHRFRDLAAQVGEAEAGQRSYMAVEDGAAIVSEAEMARDAAAYERLKSRPRMPGFRLLGAPAEGPKMSHAWAVSGARSKTGRPLLESDPQLPLGSPPFFHEVHLVAAGIDARGLAIPGCPGLFIGFNRRVAWGMSALGAGSQAVFLETLTADGGGYRFAGQSVAFARRLERIVVKGGADVVQEVLTTRHGVVFDSLTPTARAGEAQVLHDAQTLGHGATVRALLAWLTAGNWAEFRAAMEHYYDPGVHLVYADADGNLGYQTLVYRPLTSTSPRLAQEGWTGEQEVSGRIPLDELPHMLNPASGVISHANNMPVGTWYPYDLGIGTGGNGHTGRSWRLQRLLSGTRTFAVEDFEAEIHRDAVNQVVAALLPVARRVAEEDGTADPAVTRLLAAVAGWDLRADSVDRCPAAAALQNAMTPYRGSGLNDTYGAGMGGVTNLARRLAADFERDGATPRGERERAYLHRWLQASAQGSGGDRRTAAGDDWTARLAAGTAPPAGRTITIPYQRMAPLNLPAVDAALDITSPPLACLDTGTIWSQPGNLYTQIVDLADIDNSRAMIAPGNSEDGTDPQRTAGIELWVEGRTRPAPLSRARVERLGGTRTEVAVQAYSGPDASPLRTVEKPEAGWLFVAAIPPPAAATPPQPRPRPADAQRPDDPRIEAHFRVVLRQDTPAAEVDAQLAACREYAGTDAGLVQQLRGAAVLGVYLIEESTAGRLKVQYGSPYALDRLRGLLTEIDAVPKTPPAPPADPGPPAAAAPAAVSAATGLIGHWPLRGDCADVSGNGLHGTNHGVPLQDAVFDGRSAYIEVPPAPKLQLGTGDFTLAAWVWTAPDVDDVIGDVVSRYDPVRRCGFSLTLKASAGGYSSQGDDRHACFGIDNAQEPAWEDCGRPSPTSNYVSNSLTVFDGHLYAAITDAERTEDWCHVFRYAGGQAWEDCGRVGNRRTHGVGPMVVHRGSLYAATWTYDWTRVGIQEPLDDYGCVYRYAGGTTWEDCGQPGQCRRLFGLASFRGALYVTAEDGRCYVHAGGREWRECGRFPNYAHPLGVHDGKLYAGVLNPAGVWAFDGERWEALGNPQGSEDRCNQIHALQVFRGRLHATTWPEGHVVRLEPDGRWLDCGRLGDALEINALNVHNGQLYAGTIPRAEVFRYAAAATGVPVEAPAPGLETRPRRRRAAGAPDTGSPAWNSVGRFLDPAGYEFKTPNEWARVTSLTTFQGRQYASLGSCTSSRLDAPCDFRGRVFAMQAGPCVSVDRDLGSGWKHLTAVRRGSRLELHVDGRLAATSAAFRPAAFDLSSDSPLRIGFGEVDYFSGRIRDVRLYGRALGSDEIAALAAVPADAPPRAGAEAAPRRRVPVRDFGALPGSGKDATEAIRAAIAAAIAAGPDAEVTLEGGEYRVGAGAVAGYCFPMHGADGLTIRGVGRDTRIVVTRPDAGAFLFGTCRRAAIADVSIDYDPVPFCQGAVAAVDVEGGWFDLEVDAGYPTPDAPNFVGAAEPYGKWGMIMDRETRRIRPGTPDHYMTPTWEPRGGRVWRFFTAQEHYRLGLRHMRVGDAYVHLARGYGGAILAQACDGVAIERVVVHASPGLVVGLVGNKGTIVVRGLEARFAPRSDRLLTANADGVHGQQNRSGPVIEDCYFEGMADDGVNLYAPPNVVREVRSPTEWLVTPGCLILPGERLQVVDPGAGTLLGQVTAAGVAVEGRAFRLTLDKAVAGVRAGDDHRSACTLYNLDACGAGFRICRNTMNGNRRYGCLLRAGDGLVEGNTFVDTTGAGVVATNEPDWPEGPIPWGITVRGNRFVRGGTCLGYADTPTGAQLIVRPTRLGHGLAEAPAVRTVVIESNEFVDPLGPAIFVGGAADVRVTGNRVHAAAAAPRLLPGPAVRVERCEEVTITGGEFLDRRPGTTRDVETDTPPQARPGVGAPAP